MLVLREEILMTTIPLLIRLINFLLNISAWDAYVYIKRAYNSYSFIKYMPYAYGSYDGKFIAFFKSELLMWLPILPHIMSVLLQQ